MTDYRALCALLARQLDDALDFSVSSETRLYNKALVARTRAALAEEQGEDRQILNVFYDACMSEGGSVDEIHLRGLRAVLARWGHHPTPPAEGEVAELVEWLGQLSEMACTTEDANQLDRVIAELLQQQHPTPVPVSERLPGEGDCDAEGRCWLLTVEDEYPQWRLHSIEGHQPGGRMIWIPVDRTPGVMVDAFYASHWIPAHALPLPQGEVK